MFPHGSRFRSGGGPVTVMSNSGLWSGDAEFSFSGADIANTTSEKSIFTTAPIALAGQPVTVDWTWTGGDATTLLSFFTPAHSWASGAAGGFSGTAQRSCGFGNNQSLNDLYEWDWANINAPTLASSGANADVTNDPTAGGGACQLIRQADGAVLFKTAGSLRFTTATPTAVDALHLAFGQSNNTSLNFDNISWTIGAG